MIYKNERWGEDKYYQIVHSHHSGFILREYDKGARKTEITMTTEDKLKFEKILKDNDWYEFVRS